MALFQLSEVKWGLTELLEVNTDLAQLLGNGSFQLSEVKWGLLTQLPDVKMVLALLTRSN